MIQVLVVDDDMDLLFMVKRILMKDGYSVKALVDCINIFQALADQLPDIIILDINLGQCDGRILCHEIKQKDAYKHIPVILYSSDIYDESICSPCEASGFIQKPFTNEFFIHALKQFAHKN